MKNSMINIFTSIAVIIFLSGAFAKEDHHHHSKPAVEKKNEHSKSSLVLNNGKKWSVDQDMRTNMDLIYQQFNSFNEFLKLKKTSTEEAHKLSAVINESAKNIISKCKMEQKQDEVFHVLLAELFVVAKDLEKAEKVERALKKLDHTLRNYSEFFDHSFAN